MKNIVVVGMGYVGIPVAAELANAGFNVTGINRSQGKVDLINKGICPVGGDEPRLADMVRDNVKAGRFRATTDYSACRKADAVVVAVQTPVEHNDKMPMYKELRGAVTDIGRNLSKGTLVSIESTIAPKTMETIVQPILEKESGLKAGTDFYLANCPERVMPGRLLHNIEEYDRVVGGINKKSCDLVIEMYKKVVKGKFYPTDCLTAEIVKTAENTYRDVQIAFSNEMAMICEDLGADVYEVRELVNKCPFRDMHIPGAGVGGHCLPKDTWLLIANLKGEYEPKLMKTARAINDFMPAHAFDLLKSALQEAGIAIKDANIAVLGFSYLQNSDDTRNTPSLTLISKLWKDGAHVRVHDPYVGSYEGVDILHDLDAVMAGSHALVIMTAHKEYKALNLEKIKKMMAKPIIIDGRNLFEPAAAKKAGFAYKGIGKGKKL